ncbi:MAG: alpha/beta fold hydrolase [Rhizobiales bacterium]|nr:alpha/beta fold hydrolase [Hyphomicrobiales bacterium]
MVPGSAWNGARATFFAAGLVGLTALPATADFYDVTPAELPGAPGSIIRFEVRNLAPAGATVFRLLYRSTDPEGHPVAVSAIAIRPEGETPAGGRDVVAWAHATSGVVRPCAPSLREDGYAEIPGLADLLGHGYAVVATDYPGLGTAGPHPYLIGASEAHAVLDSVRALAGIRDIGASNRFIVWGHSQGGQAALFTGQLAERYAPDLRLLGVVAAAPATELGQLFDDDLTSAAGKVLTAMTLYAWNKLYGFPLAEAVDAPAIPEVERIGETCIDSIVGDLEDLESQRPLKHKFLKIDPAKQPPWADVTAANVPGQEPIRVPVFIAQGLADKIVHPSVTEEFVTILCARDTTVRFLKVPDVGHPTIPERSAPQSVEWIAERFAGNAAPNDCRR